MANSARMQRPPWSSPAGRCTCHAACPPCQWRHHTQRSLLCTPCSEELTGAPNALRFIARCGQSKELYGADALSACQVRAAGCAQRRWSKGRPGARRVRQLEAAGAGQEWCRQLPPLPAVVVVGTPVVILGMLPPRHPLFSPPAIVDSFSSSEHFA